MLCIIILHIMLYYIIGTEEKYNKVDEQFQLMLQHRVASQARSNGVSAVMMINGHSPLSLSVHIGWPKLHLFFVQMALSQVFK